MGKKGKVTLYMDLEIVQKAKEIGLNVSKTCENALKNTIQRLESQNPTNTSKNFSVNAFSKRVERARRDLNP